MRVVWSLYRHGTEIFAARLYRAARAAPREAGPSVAAPSWWILVRSMATRYVPPSIDVEVYVFVADDGCRLDTEPEYWRRLAPRVTEINVPGTHMSTVISERARLAFALTRAIADAAAQRSFRPSSEAPRSSRSPAMLGGQPG